MRWHRSVVVTAGALFWACAGFVAMQVGLLHPSVQSAWLLSGAFLWGPTPASLPASLYDERRLRGASWLAVVIQLGIWATWVRAGHSWL